MTDWFTDTGFGYLLGVAVVALLGLALLSLVSQTCPETPESAVHSDQLDS